jgi:hypothetical protein
MSFLIRKPSMCADHVLRRYHQNRSIETKLRISKASRKRSEENRFPTLVPPPSLKLVHVLHPTNLLVFWLTTPTGFRSSEAASRLGCAAALLHTGIHAEVFFTSHQSGTALYELAYVTSSLVFRRNIIVLQVLRTSDVLLLFSSKFDARLSEVNWISPPDPDNSEHKRRFHRHPRPLDELLNYLAGSSFQCMCHARFQLCSHDVLCPTLD